MHEKCTSICRLVKWISESRITWELWRFNGWVLFSILACSFNSYCQYAANAMEGDFFRLDHWSDYPRDPDKHKQASDIKDQKPNNKGNIFTHKDIFVKYHQSPLSLIHLQRTSILDSIVIYFWCTHGEKIWLQVQCIAIYLFKDVGFFNLKVYFF